MKNLVLVVLAGMMFMSCQKEQPIDLMEVEIRDFFGDDKIILKDGDIETEVDYIIEYKVLEEYTGAEKIILEFRKDKISKDLKEYNRMLESSKDNGVMKSYYLEKADYYLKKMKKNQSKLDSTKKLYESDKRIIIEIKRKFVNPKTGVESFKRGVYDWLVSSNNQ